MGGMFGGGKAPQAQKQQPAGALNVQTSIFGSAYPLCYGKNRVPVNLIHYFNFTPIPHTQKQQTGGKGGPKPQSTTTYTYKVAFAAGFAVGGVTGVGTVWKNKEKHTLASAGLTLFTGAAGQAPWPYLASNRPSEGVPYANLAYVAATAFDLGDSPSLPNLNVEYKGLCQYAPGTNEDALISDIVQDYLTDARHGVVGFAPYLGNLDNGPASFRKYCLARGLFISPFENNQRQAGAFIKEMAEIANSAIVWRQGKLEFIPYGDATITGNGATYTPDLTPLYDLTVDDFMFEKGQPPVKHKEKPAEQAYNHHRIEFNSRANDYNPAIVELKDQADIDDNGLRTKAVTKYSSITLESLARDVLQLQQQRDLHVKNTYAFRLPVRFSLLEPMDLVTITDTVLGLDKQLVRIIEVTELDDAVDILAEEVNIGVANAPLYSVQPPSGYNQDFNVSAGSVSDPLIVNAPGFLTPSGFEQWIAVTGLNANWGGCIVWVSDDNVSYRRVGEVLGGARYGSVSNVDGMAAGSANYDTTSVLRVQLYKGQVLAGTQLDCDEFRTLLYVGGEWMSYRDAVLVSGTTYDLDTFRRAAYGSARTAHAQGQGVMVVDEAIFRLPYDKGNVGKTVYFKFQSFNCFGGGFQDLSTCAAYTHVLGGSELTAPMDYIEIAGSGVNLLDDRYSTFEAAQLPPLTISPTVAYTRVTDGNSVIKNSLYLGVGATTVWLGNGYNIALTPGKRYIVSFWARSSQANNTFLPFIETSAGYTYGASIPVTVADTFQRISTIIDLSNSTATSGWLGISKQQSEAAYIDGIMLEEAVGTLNQPSAYVRGQAASHSLAALVAAQSAQSTADGIVDIWPASTTAPAIGGANGAKVGDYWRDLSANGRWKVCDGTSWVDATDSRLPQALTDAANAQSTANSKIRLFIQEAQPTATTVGDQWFKPSTKETRYWNGSGWSLQSDQTAVMSDMLVQNPGFEADSAGWTLETGWYIEQSSNAAFYGVKGAIHAGGNVAGGHQASRVYSSQGFPVTPGQRIFVGAKVRSLSADGNMLIGVLFYTAAGALLSESNKDYLSAPTLAGTSWRNVNGKFTVPRTAAIARVQAFSQTHLNGYYAVDEFRAAYIDTVTEAPVNGTNLIPNSNFSSNEGSWPTGVYDTFTVGDFITDGWYVERRDGYLAGAAGAAGMETSSVNGNYRQLFIGDQGGTIANGACAFYVATSQKFQVVAGQKYSIDYRYQVDSANAVPAGVARYTYMGIWGYDAAGNRTWYGGVSNSANGSFSGSTVVEIPTNVVMVQGVVGFDMNNTTGGNVTMPWATTHSRYQNFVVRRILNLDSAAVEDGGVYGRIANEDTYGSRRLALAVKGSRRILGGARNMRPAQVMGYSAVRSTTALSANSSGQVTVNAHTVDINGEAITYNAVTDAVTGLTQGVQYAIYCQDLYLDGGTRTWYATTNAYTVQQTVEGAVFAGNVTIPTSGSSSGGAGGGGIGGGDCVDALSRLPCGRMAGEIKAGDFIWCWDYDADEPRMVLVEVESNHTALELSTMLRTESGVEVIASDSTPMTLRDGSTTYIPYMRGEYALVAREGGNLAWEQVDECVAMGYRVVAHIRVKQHCYFAGRTAGAYIATHNPTYKP